MVEKLEFSKGQTNKILKKEICINEKAKQTFLQHLPVPVQLIVKSFEVLIVPFLKLKIHVHADFL